MITYLRGSVVSCSDDAVVLDVNGVGYKIVVPPLVLEDLRSRAPEEEVTLTVHHYLQIDQNRAVPMLIGFRNEQEREFYLALAGVLGPKSAVKCLAAPLGRIAQSIELGDTAFLRSLPGIGPQKARDLISKLQGKLGPFLALEAKGPAVAPIAAGESDMVADAISALQDLGYKRPEAAQLVHRAMRENPGLATVEDLLGAIFARK